MSNTEEEDNKKINELIEKIEKLDNLLNEKMKDSSDINIDGGEPMLRNRNMDDPEQMKKDEREERERAKLAQLEIKKISWNIKKML